VGALCKKKRGGGDPGKEQKRAKACSKREGDSITIEGWMQGTTGRPNPHQLHSSRGGGKVEKRATLIKKGSGVTAKTWILQKGVSKQS